MPFFVPLLLTLVMISLIVLVHEFGHYITAVKSGILVEEFAMGMGPKIWSKKVGDTLFSLRVFPLGGFCKMLGDEGEDSGETDSRAFCNKSVWKRILVISSGALMNFALAVVVLTLLYLFDGTYLPVAESIVEGYPAQEAGIMQGDRIIKLNNIKINTYEDFNFYMQDFYGQPIELTIKRGKETFTVNTETKIYEEDGYRRYIFGFVRQEKKGIFESGEAQSISIGEAFHEGICSMAFYVKVPLTMLVKEIASRQLSINDFSSMVGVVSIVEDIVETPSETPDVNVFWDIVARMARFLGIITTSVGLVNLFPLPALDGGRLIFLFYEAIFKRRVAPSKEAVVHAIGLFALLAFGAAVIINELFLYYI